MPDSLSGFGCIDSVISPCILPYTDVVLIKIIRLQPLSFAAIDNDKTEAIYSWLCTALRLGGTLITNTPAAKKAFISELMCDCSSGIVNSTP